MASDGFRRLHETLVETKQRIELARAHYSEIAMTFATRLEIVPDRFVAALARTQPKALLHAESFERAAVEVNFA